MTSVMIRLMLGVVCFVLAFALSYPMVKVATNSMSQLNCSVVTDYQPKSVCTMLDLSAPLIVGLIAGISGFLLTNH